MTEPTVGPDIDEALDVHGDLSAEGTFHLVVPLDLLSEEVDLLIVQILGPTIRIHTTGIQKILGPASPDPVNIGQGNLDPFPSG
jgi:hypothetical protein